MLSSFLLSRTTEGKQRNVDEGLDTIFSTSAKPVAAPISKVDTSIAKPDPSSSTSTKRKRDITGDSGVAEPIKKRKKAESDADATEIQHKSKHVAIKKKDRKDNAISETTKEKPGGAKQANIDSDSDEVMKELEERYLKQKLGSSSSKAKEDQKKTPKPTLVEVIPIKPSTNEPANSIESSDKSDEDDEADFNPETLVHETVSGAAQNKTGKRRKVPYAPEGETKEQRDERTVFIGNLPPDVLKMKSAQKALKRHLLSFASSSKEQAIQIESIRFRSVAFKKPTNLPELNDIGKEKATKTKGRKQDRATAWKNENADQEADSNINPAKSYLTPAEKKRIAFIKGELHDEGASANAYAVIAHPPPPRKLNEESEEVTYDPYVSAGLLVQRMDGSQFMDRTLRLDRVGRPAYIIGPSQERDTAATIFVGNLDFTAKEEDIRTFFETLLTAEIGPPRTEAGDGNNDDVSGGEEEDDNTSKSRSNDGDKKVTHSESKSRWVHNVRIIRDKDTQLGKGFAYVRFTERTCVDEILAMEPTKVKFSKRKLRVQRCKANTGAPSGPVISPKSGGTKQGLKSAADSGSRSTTTNLTSSKPHRGDPLLGERLKSLPKEERKEIKKQDANRLARRMEKKKKRQALDKALGSDKVRDRTRIRKIKSTVPFKARSQQGPKNGRRSRASA